MGSKVVALALILGLISCSSARRSQKGHISRTKYNDLKWRYEKLLQEHGENLSQGQKIPTAQGESIPSAPVPAPSRGGGEVVEEVDLSASGPPPAPLGPSVQIHDVGDEVDIYKKAWNLFKKDKLEASLTQAKKIEGSKNRQVSVHAKFLIGEIMFELKEFDVAMQIYQDILSQDAFSGLVLDSLRRLVQCSEKLGLPQKAREYRSLLGRFFKSEGGLKQ